MKKSFASRTAVGIAALSLVIASTSCGIFKSKEPGSSSADPTAAITHAYRAVEMDGALSLDYIDSMVKLGDSGNVLISGSMESGSELYITDTEFTDFSKVELDVGAGENVETNLRTAAAPDGTIFVIATVTDYGDFELPDWNDPDFDYESYDFDALQEAAEVTYELITLGSDGTLISSSELTGLEEYTQSDDDNSYVYLGGIYPCDNETAVIYVSGSGPDEVYLAVGSDGKVQKQLDLGEDTWFYSACCDNEGNLAFLTWEGSGEVIKTIDAASLELTGNVIELKDLELSNVYNMMSGSGEYSYYLSNSSSLYGVRSDGTGDELINWLDSDLNGDYINGIISLDNGEFVIYEQNYSTGSSGFYRLTERDASELADTTILTMAVVYADSDVTAYVTEFNKTSDKYRIRLNEYSKYYEWDEENQKQLNSPTKQLKMDIAAGKAPDMLYFNDPGIFKGLSSKGVFVDLYDYLGTNGAVSKEDIMPPLLKACEVNGKLLSISPNFVVQTQAAKTKFADKENWTLDDLIETYNNLPDGMKLFRYDNTKMSVFGILYAKMNLVDMENATCNFDSPEFIKLLEFCNRFPDENEEINWETATDDEMDKFYNEQEVALRNDKALLDSIYFYNLRQYNHAKYGTFGDDITLVGYPTDNGSGAMVSTQSSFAILSSSANKDACWDFISRFFTDEYQDKYGSWQIPALISVFEQKMNDAMEDPYWLDENGKKQTYEDTEYIMGEEIKIPKYTKEEKDYIHDYIMNAEPDGMFIYDSDVNDIVVEEVQAYFKGERSAQEAAEIIQNRVSIMVSEQS